MIVGTFTKTETGAFEGDIETLIFSAAVEIVPIEQTKDRAPSYRVYSTHNKVEVGAGWNETSKRTKEPYISIKIDDPSFAYPMWAALTKSDTGYQLNWSRPRSNSAPQTTDTSETL